MKTVEKDGIFKRIESRITKEIWTPDRFYSDWNRHWDFSEEP